MHILSEPSPPNTVEVTAYPENSITVDWSDPVCENSPYIVYYIIKWCITDISTKKCVGMLINEDNEMWGMELTDLRHPNIFTIRIAFLP